MKSFVTAFFVLTAFALRAQFSFVVDPSIPIERDNEELPFAWAGGLNAVQYNTMDLNGDGLEDLVLFDRMADKITTFINQNNQYHYQPDYESLLPSEISNWLLIRDYNCDGKKDIFTGDILGVRLFTNVTEPGGNLEWKHRKFYDNGGASNVVLTKGFSATKINLQLQFDDIPSILDADGDGDLDIFTVRFAGNGTVEYHKNLGLENFGRCDSIDFVRQTIQWGDFTECTCGMFAFNGEDCSSLGGRIEHAGGKSLLAIDANGDSRLDLIMSEASCNRLYYLPNGGDLDNPVINTASTFPATNAAALPYPAAFVEDVDFDGKKDLLASPAIFTKPFFTTNLASSNWFYKNTGTNANPSFTFTQSDFLQDKMIDVGDNAVPAFVDADADGDYDMFISMNNSPVTVATIFVFENVGTAASPRFRWVEDNYLDFTTLDLFNLKIQFTDINRDSKIDLAFTATSFRDGSTRLYYIPNQNYNGLNLRLSDVTSTSFTMAGPENVLVVDVDQDGQPDLLHGRSNGALAYLRNQGNLNFQVADEDFLGIGSSVLRQNLACSVGDLNNDDKADLLIGDQTGELRILDDFRDKNNIDEIISNVVWNPLKEAYESRNHGGRIWPTIVNLNNTLNPSVVIGNSLGGIVQLRPDHAGELPEQPVIKLYPNPVAKDESLNIAVDRAASFQIIAATGQVLNEPIYLPVNSVFQYSVSHLSAGLYIVRFQIDGKSFARRLVIR